MASIASLSRLPRLALLALVSVIAIFAATLLPTGDAIRVASSSDPTILKSQLDVLRQLGAQSGKDFVFKSWTASGAPDKCSKYRGVTCDAEGKIVAINATSANLVGPIDALSTLDQLQRLSNAYPPALSPPPFPPTVPSSLPPNPRHSPPLPTALRRSSPLLTAPRPSSSPRPNTLRDSDLSSNSEVKALPQSFTKLKKLSHLSIGGNPLEGAVPASFGSLVNLVSLYLRNNRFNGPLPDFIGSFTNLEQL
ncbi:unnamed protein product [Closterium sp. NIES-65]|nr:unnamed protein product [Closterium sp. NIES-65]